jgi:hypothetical protein
MGSAVKSVYQFTDKCSSACRRSDFDKLQGTRFRQQRSMFAEGGGCKYSITEPMMSGWRF